MFKKHIKADAKLKTLRRIAPFMNFEKRELSLNHKLLAVI